MEEGILSLKWNNHNSTFIHTLSSLHKVESYSDVTLACEGKYFPVHKLVLSICSEYFEEIFSQTKCQHPVIVLKDIRPSDLEALLNYMYAGEANVSQSELASLIKAAECLRIKGLAVPDESPPVRDKRRLGETSDSFHSSKKRKSDEPYILSHYKAYESDSENTRIYNKNKRRSEDSSHRSISENRSEDSSSISLHEDETYRSIVIPEVKLEGDSVEVKQEVSEPKIEEHLENDSHQHLESTNIGISYAVNIGTDTNKDDDSHSQDSHIIPELITHSVAGPSGVQGHETMSNWENNTNNISSYPGENFSPDDGRTQQLEAYGEDHISNHRAVDSRRLGLSPSRAWQCPYEFCGYFADRGSSLLKHIRKHTGEKPFACSFCSFSSAQKSNLNSHMKIRHSEEFKKIHDQKQSNFRIRIPCSSSWDISPDKIL